MDITTLAGNCLQYSRNVVLKANHNSARNGSSDTRLFTIFKKCCVESKSQLSLVSETMPQYCLQYSRNVVLKANHNSDEGNIILSATVYNIQEMLC